MKFVFLQEIPLIISILVLLYSLRPKNIYGIYLLLSLALMHVTIILIKNIGKKYNLYGWETSECFEDLASFYFNDDGSMPSAHMATISYFAITIFSDYPLFGFILILLQFIAQNKDNCHTNLQNVFGIFYGLFFGLFTIRIFDMNKDIYLSKLSFFSP